MIDGYLIKFIFLYNMKLSTVVNFMCGFEKLFCVGLKIYFVWIL